MQNPGSNLPLVRLSSVNPFLLELARRNLDGGAILRRLGLPDDVPASSDLFASALSIYKIVEESALAANDPHMGFNIGERLDLLRWDPIANAAQEANTVGDLLRRFVVNALDHTSSTTFYVRTEGERTLFGFDRVVVPEFSPAQNDAFYLGIFAKMLKEATSPHWNPAKVLARVSRPDAVPLRQGLPRLAEGDNNGMSISFPTDWQFADLRKSAFSRSPSHARTVHVPASLVDAVRVALAPHVHDLEMTVERAARICGYEKRSLSRKLQAAGTTIIKEISAVRASEAEKSLTETDLSIAKIGESVGFKDPTVFSRAFKNWTGQSPRQFRRNNRP